MKLVMTLLVRDEEDILASNLDFHLQQGVDFFIVTDNLSVDSTPDIVRDYVHAGVAQCLHEGEDNFAQHRWVTRMARMAALDHGADWVINSDADEFWLPASGFGTMKDVLASIPGEVPAVFANRSNFVPLGCGRGANPVREMIFKEQASKAPFGEPLPAKVAHRAFPDVAVEQGNHAVCRHGARLHAVAAPLQIFHYPLRFYTQFENKIAKGGAAYARNSELPYESGRSWRELYKLWCAGELPSYFRERALSPEQIQEQLQNGALVVDRTAADLLNKSWLFEGEGHK
jgi:hypothetical protein